jgi:hypothetical protein
MTAIIRAVPQAILAIAILAGCAAAAPSTTPAEMAPASSSTPRLIGIHATGAQVDLDRLQTFATASGFPSQQMDAPEGHELVIAFPPGSDPAAISRFIEQLRGSQFSSLQFGSAYAPAEQ